MTAYEQGFMAKCAEYGVDPEWLVGFMEKDAFRISPALKELLGQIPKAGRSALVAQARKMPYRNHGELMKNITRLLEKQIGAVKQVGVERFPAAAGTDFQKLYAAMNPGQRRAALSNIRQGIFGTDTGKLVDHLNQVGLGSYGNGVNMRARRDMVGYITDAMSKGKSGRLNPQALKWRANGVSNRLSSRLGNTGGDALAARQGLSQTELKDLLKAKYGNRIPPKMTAVDVERAAANSQATVKPVRNVRSRVSSSSGRVPRKRIDPATGRAVPRVRSVSGKSPVGPVSASGAGINVTPYGTVEGVGGNIPIMPGYTKATGATPAINAARDAARRPPVRDASGNLLPIEPYIPPEKLGPWGRFLQLMGGGNDNARKITSNRRAVRAMKRFLAEGSGTAPLGSDRYTNAVGRFNSKITETNADIARRLQNGGKGELNKVLAARLGTAAGITGLGALGINEMRPDYRSSDPRHSLDYWG